MHTRKLDLSNLLVPLMAVAALLISILPYISRQALAAPSTQASVQEVSATTIPRTFTYQGVLRLPDGKLANGVYSMTFRIYDAVTGGTALHTELISNVVVRDGIFSALLGDSQSNPLKENVFTASPRYVGIVVGNDPEMSPRQHIYPVPWSLMAGTLQQGAQGFGIVPIGAILPWHKSLTGTPSLPNGWVECSGQTLNDSQSPLNGQRIPDLNVKALFIRGGATSGVFQEDQMQSHTHIDSGHTHSSHDSDHNLTPHYVDYSSNEYGEYHGATTGVGYANLGNPSESTAGPVRQGNETRPVNMSMVWIMRVK